MSTSRMEKLFQVPVPRMPVKGVKEDSLSKKLRSFDNEEIQAPFSDNMGVYINTNESNTANIHQNLSNFPTIRKPFHIGFSGGHNFDIMAQRRSSGGLICDVNPENAMFLSRMLKYLRLYSDKDTFMQKMTDFINKYNYEDSRSTLNKKDKNGIKPKSVKFNFNVSDEFPYSDSGHYSVQQEIFLEEKRETSWLYTNSGYAHIRKLALEDKIAVITEDICKSQVFHAIGHLLVDNCIQVDTVYVSNISEWMRSEIQKKRFLDSVKGLLTDNETILIDAKCHEDGNNSYSPIQRCTLKGYFNEEHSLENWFFPKKALVLDEVPSSKISP